MPTYQQKSQRKAIRTDHHSVQDKQHKFNRERARQQKHRDTGQTDQRHGGTLICIIIILGGLLWVVY